MSLRDWFAGMALQGILANRSFCEAVFDPAACELALAYADAMIAQRSKSS